MLLAQERVHHVLLRVVLGARKTHRALILTECFLQFRGLLRLREGDEAGEGVFLQIAWEYIKYSVLNQVGGEKAILRLFCSSHPCSLLCLSKRSYAPVSTCYFGGTAIRN